LENVFEKIGKENVKVTVYFSNSIKIW